MKIGRRRRLPMFPSTPEIPYDRSTLRNMAPGALRPERVPVRATQRLLHNAAPRAAFADFESAFSEQ